MHRYLTATILFFLPNRIAFLLLNQMGHSIHKSVKIGWSWIFCDFIIMEANTSIQHFNIIRIDQLVMKNQASIQTFNRMKGPLTLKMGREATIGNSNSIYRGNYPITVATATLEMGAFAIITSKHHFDCTRSIKIGDYTTISGLASQFWTHGFYHADSGIDRIRVDGKIIIGNNVSVGSRCLINPSIRIGNCINIGGNVCVAKSIEQPGMYVAQPLRYLNKNIKTIEAKLERDKDYKNFRVFKKAV